MQTTFTVTKPALLGLSYWEIGDNGANMKISVGESPFEMLASVPSPSGAIAAYYKIFDFNGDGFEEFVTTTSSLSAPSTISIYSLQEDNMLGLLTEVEIPEQGTFEYGDLNGDGRTDLVMSAKGGFYIYYQTENNTLASPQFLEVSACADFEATYFAVGDFNADGKNDLVASDSCTRERVWYWLQAAGSLQDIAAYNESPIYGHKIMDINGDGLLDLVGFRNEPNMIVLQTNLGDFTFSTDAYPVTARRHESDVYLLELTGDGNRDLLITDHFSFSVYARRENSYSLQGTYSILDSGDSFLSGRQSFLAGDINDDGLIDIVIRTPFQTHFAMKNLEGNYAITSTDLDRHHVGSHTGLAAFDINYDGKKDVLLGSGFASLSVSPGRFLTIWLNGVSQYSKAAIDH